MISILIIVSLWGGLMACGCVDEMGEFCEDCAQSEALKIKAYLESKNAQARRIAQAEGQGRDRTETSPVRSLPIETYDNLLNDTIRLLSKGTYGNSENTIQPVTKSEPQIGRSPDLDNFRFLQGLNFPKETEVRK